jgi:SAM-dependent methyltransferase
MDESPSTRDPWLFLHILKRLGLRKALGFGVYDDEFYAEHEEWELSYADLASAINLVFRPASVCDFGCGNAFVIHYLKQAGVAVKGVERSREAVPHIPAFVRPEVLIASVTRPLSLGSFELVISTEVAEHLPKKTSAVFIRNLVQHATTAVLFTAAQPGQWGDGHINCQPRSFWERLFSQHGWRISDSLQYQMLEAIRQRPRVDRFLPWISKNLMVFAPIRPPRAGSE